MNTPPNPDSQLLLEAKILFHDIQIAALQEILAKIGDVVLHSKSGKKTPEILRELRARNIQNIPRYLADTDPTKASQLLVILKQMNAETP